MGFKNKKTVFTPLDLNEEVVQTVFNRCLPTEKTENYVSSILEPKELGYKEDSDELLFDYNKIMENHQLIHYLYGQLAVVHEDDNLDVTNGIKKYDSTIWTDNCGILMEFLHLGVANNSISQFLAKYNAVVFTKAIVPTFSPNDPNFTKEFAEYEKWFKEYETKRKSEQELSEGH